MPHPIHRVSEFQIVAPYTLRLRFEDGSEQTINFQPVLAGELYGPLNDLALFNQVRIDLEAHTLVWPNGADFDPSDLYDWTFLERAFVDRTRRWEAKSLGQS